MTQAQASPTNFYNQASPTFTKLSPEVLANLVHRAQAQDQEAVDKLCQQFAPLVKATASSYSCFSALGEDALSIGWIILLKAIQSYNKEDFKAFPGYLQQALRTRLINEFFKLGNLDNHLIYDDFESAPPAIASFADTVFTNLTLRQALEGLRPADKRLLEEIYFESVPFYILALRYNASPDYIYMRHGRALKRLRTAYKKLVS